MPEMTKGGDVVEVHGDLTEAMEREGWKPETAKTKKASGAKSTGSTEGSSK